MAASGQMFGQKWSRRAVALSAAMTSLLVSGCTATGVNFERYIAAAPSSTLQLSWVEARRTTEGIQVWGQVQQAHCCHRLRGYIRFDAEGANGIRLASTNGTWGEFNPRQLHSAWFRAVLPVPKDKAVSVIHIDFYTEP